MVSFTLHLSTTPYKIIDILLYIPDKKKKKETHHLELFISQEDHT